MQPDASDKRPWGSFTVIWESRGSKVKILDVLPLKRLSLQRHKHRSEHWFVVRGSGSAIVESEEGVLVEIAIVPGSSVDVPCGKKHRLIAGSDGMEIVEVQTGSSFEESDIERFEDDFNRTANKG